MKRERWVLLGEAAISGRALCFVLQGELNWSALGRVSGCFSLVGFFLTFISACRVEKIGCGAHADGLWFPFLSAD